MTPAIGFLKGRKSLLIAVLALLAALFPFFQAYDYPGMNMDEGMLLVYPELLLKGKLPYRDFETYYGPGNIYTLAGAYSIFGVSVTVERTVGLIYRALLLVGIFVFARRWGSTAATFSVLLAAMILIFARLLAFAWLGGVACVMWSLLALSGNPGRWRAGLAGLLAAAALLFRPDLGLAVIVSALPLFFRLPSRERWFYVGGGAIGLLPLAALTAIVGLQPIVENLFLYPVVITNPGRRLPFSDAPAETLFLIAFHAGAAIFAVITGLLAWRQNRQSADARLFLGFALLAAGLTHQCTQRADMFHVTTSIFLSVAMLPLALIVLARRGRIELPSVRWSFAMGAAVLAAVFFGAPKLVMIFVYQNVVAFDVDANRSSPITVRERSFPGRAYVEETRSVVGFLERQSKPGERLFVGTGDLRFTFANDTFIYHLLPWLEPATYFLEMNPLSANRPNSRLASDVASADWLVLNDGWTNSHEPNLSVRPGSDAPNEVVRTQFELRGRTGTFEVYHRRGARETPVAAN